MSSVNSARDSGVFAIVCDSRFKNSRYEINVYDCLLSLSKEPVTLFEVVHYSITTVLRTDEL